MRTPRIGCSGWNYASWRGPFYPSGLATSRWLAFYAARFDTVEVNGTFYRLPERSTFEAWRQQAPSGFVFAVKASRFLTHMKRLRDAREPLTRLFSRLEGLGSRLGPVLYQLPPTMTVDPDRLQAFLELLPRRLASSPRRLQHVVECRHPSWYVEETFSLLRRAGVSLCLHDKRGSEFSGPPVGPIAYIRFHGTSGHYHGGYPDETLDAWAQRIVEFSRGGRSVYAYFNNDPDAIATQNALTLRRSTAGHARHAALLAPAQESPEPHAVGLTRTSAVHRSAQSSRARRGR
jgi:uncharacterized protein YecE (DUF72 family)